MTRLRRLLRPCWCANCGAEASTLRWCRDCWRAFGKSSASTWGPAVGAWCLSHLWAWLRVQTLEQLLTLAWRLSFGLCISLAAARLIVVLVRVARRDRPPTIIAKENGTLPPAGKR